MKRKNLKSLIHNRKNATVGKNIVSHTPIQQQDDTDYKDIVSDNIFLYNDSFPVNDVIELDNIVKNDHKNINTNNVQTQQSNIDKHIISKVVKNNTIVKSLQVKMEENKKKMNDMKLENMTKNITIMHLQKEIKTLLTTQAKVLLQKSRTHSNRINQLTKQIDALELMLKQKNTNTDQNIMNNNREEVQQIMALKSNLEKKIESISHMSKKDIDINSLFKYSIELKDEHDKLKKSKNVKYMESLIKTNEIYKQNNIKLLEHNKVLHNDMIKKNKIIQVMTEKSKILLHEQQKTLDLNASIMNQFQKRHKK